MSLLACLISPIVALIFSPLFAAVINRTKAAVAGRKGPPLLQGYFDLLRLLRKGMVLSGTTSWIFRVAPVLIFAATLAAACFVPFFPVGSPVLSFTGDLVVLLYLLAFARFFLILSALDTGSAFEGMGASREAFFSALAEPVIFICLLNVMRTHDVGSITAALSTPLVDSIAVLLVAIPLFLVLLSENARMPFDDPTTHLELTMIHEVMILDNSGPSLALLEYAASVKLWLFSSILARIILPGMGPVLETVILLALMAVIAIAIGLVESFMARLRLIRVPQLLFGAGVVVPSRFFY